MCKEKHMGFREGKWFRFADVEDRRINPFVMVLTREVLIMLLSRLTSPLKRFRHLTIIKHKTAAPFFPIFNLLKKVI